jgi:hypothetical protein
MAKHHTRFEDLLGGESMLRLLQSVLEHGSASNSLNVSEARRLLREGLDMNATEEERCDAVSNGFSPSIPLLAADIMMVDDEKEASAAAREGKEPDSSSKDYSADTSSSTSSITSSSSSPPSSPPSSPTNRHRSSSSKSNRREKIKRQTTVINGIKVEVEDDREQQLFASLSHVIAHHRCFKSGSPNDGDASWLVERVDENRDENGTTAGGDARTSWNQYFRSLQYAVMLIESEAAVSSMTESMPAARETVEQGAAAAATAAEKEVAAKTTTTGTRGMATKLSVLMNGPIVDLQQCRMNFTEPISALFAKYRTCVFERQQMNDFDERCLHLSVLGNYQGYLGRDTQIEEDLDDGTFTGRQIQEQIGDIMRAEVSLSTGERGMSPIEISESLDRLHEFLTTHFRTTVMIFEHYAAEAHTGGKGSMDRGEFWKLIKDVNLHKNLSGPEIDLIFQKSNLDSSTDRSGSFADSELEGHEFVEALIRLAVCKYKKSTTTDWETKFETFYIKDLLPHSKKTNKAGFREKVMTNIQMKEIIKQYHTKLKKIFVHFAAVDTSNLNITNQHTSNTVNVKELVIMARSLGMMRPGILTDSVVRTLFSHVQLNEDSSDAAADEDEMNFEEFKEVLCAIAFMLFPDPWTPAHKRLKMFFEDIFAAASKVLI